jgi:phosphomannomutase/phosphoglucomutase
MSLEKQQKRLFGTNGVRGVVGRDMNPELVLKIALALGSMRKGTIAVGRDTRTSGPGLSLAAKAGLMAAGRQVVDCGILPIPALQYLVRERFDGGVMITASHNPPEYNGVKVIEPDGTEMGDAEALLLEDRIFSERYDPVPWDQVGGETSGDVFAADYITAVTRHFPEGIGKGITVVADPGSGAACRTTPAILRALGCHVFTVNATMDGRFPGRMPEPSPEGLRDLSELVVSTGAAFGVAHDGDADRAVFVDERGRFIEENQEFALIADRVCSERKGTVVTPVSSSMMVQEIAGSHGCTVTYTPVGSIYVARTMLSLIGEGIPVAFGGEGNGGIIYPWHQFCRDGGMTAAMMVSILSQERSSLSGLTGRLPPYTMIKEKLKESDPAGLIRRLAETYREEQIDYTDGIRISRGRTWALIRPSGTEPLVRVMVESDTSESATGFHRELMDHIAKSRQHA